MGKILLALLLGLLIAGIPKRAIADNSLGVTISDAAAMLSVFRSTATQPAARHLPTAFEIGRAS